MLQIFDKEWSNWFNCSAKVCGKWVIIIRELFAILMTITCIHNSGSTDVECMGKIMGHMAMGEESKVIMHEAINIEAGKCIHGPKVIKPNEEDRIRPPTNTQPKAPASAFIHLFRLRPQYVYFFAHVISFTFDKGNSKHFCLYGVLYVRVSCSFNENHEHFPFLHHSLHSGTTLVSLFLQRLRKSKVLFR